MGAFSSLLDDKFKTVVRREDIDSVFREVTSIREQVGSNTRDIASLKAAVDKIQTGETPNGRNGHPEVFNRPSINQDSAIKLLGMGRPPITLHGRSPDSGTRGSKEGQVRRI